jgi:glutathione S-transferase
MLFIPGNIYPWVTMEDFPRRFIKVPQSSQTPADEVYGWAKEQGSENLKRMFIILEGLLKGNVDSLYAVGSIQPTLADVYIAMVSHYAPRPR